MATRTQAADSSKSQSMGIDVSKFGRAGTDQPPRGGSFSTADLHIGTRETVYQAASPTISARASTVVQLRPVIRVPRVFSTRPLVSFEPPIPSG